MAVTDTVTTSTNFIPELWSDATMDSYKTYMMPVRSRGAQLLRDFALGHPEYGPEPGDGPWSLFTHDGTSTNTTMTLSNTDTLTLGNFTVTASSV